MDVKTQKKLDHLEETKHLIREAIEEKGQTVTDSDSFRSYADKIASIETGADVSVVTATAPHVLAGDVFVDAQGNPVEGTMPNRGNVRKQLDTAQANFVLSAGYYTGGNVYLLNDIKDATPTKEEQIIRPDSGRVLSQVTVAPIPDQYQDVTPVTATAEDVKAGKVFVDAEGNAVEGALSGTIADVSGVTATAADVRQGKVIVDAQGNEVVGTLVVEQKAPDVIWVGKDSVANAQVGTGVVRYVTFMNDDGTAVYGQKSVLVGTDCIDPVAGGYMDAPTKESTEQHTYTFSGGWATEPGGGINADALKNVTEDRTVYANFISAVRYYTITYYDSDGTTVLKTESLAYGATPNYRAEKDGYRFTGWNPELATVTRNANYTAGWVESIAFADASWATIAEKTADGTASQMWSVGDTKNLALTLEDGTIENVEVMIIGFNHDTIYGSSKKAGITLMTTYETSLKAMWFYETYTLYPRTFIDTLLNTTILGYMPSDLRSVIKSVSKKVNKDNASGETTTYENISRKVWAISRTEMGETIPSHYLKYGSFLGDAYEAFAANLISWKTMTANVPDSPGFWLRDIWRNGMSSASYVARTTQSAPTINTAGSLQLLSTKRHAVFCFCI